VKTLYNNVFTIKTILRCYEIAFGLIVNFYKSKLAGINVERSVIDLYFKYLGVEVGGNPRKKQFWEPIINKLRDKWALGKGDSCH